MTEQQSNFRTCPKCAREYTADELYGNYLTVTLALNPSAAVVEDPGEIEFCPACGEDFEPTF